MGADLCVVADNPPEPSNICSTSACLYLHSWLKKGYRVYEKWVCPQFVLVSIWIIIVNINAFERGIKFYPTLITSYA